MGITKIPADKIPSTKIPADKIPATKIPSIKIPATKKFKMKKQFNGSDTYTKLYTCVIMLM